jgi:quercetin dioxygenase-like cupin family protein
VKGGTTIQHCIERTEMKRLAATVISLALPALASAHANQAGAASGSGAAPAASVQDAQTITITRSGLQPSRQGPAEYFTGSVRIDPLFQAKNPSRTSGAYVAFEPGARSAWHTHPLGQTLIVTAGAGRVQRGRIVRHHKNCAGGESLLAREKLFSGRSASAPLDSVH